jgi:DNA replication and repair protein RecF
LSEDRARGMTTVGPHRDDLVLDVGGRRLREYGSTGQQRSAAIALKLLEITALREAHGTEPVLLLDDVFAELDRERQSRLALRLLGPEERQVFITSPRPDELPPNLDLPVWGVEDGRVRVQ